MEGDVGVATFVNGKAFKVMPGILSDVTSTMRRVLVGVEACRDCRRVGERLLNEYFVCDIIKAGEDVVVSVSDGVKGGGFRVLEDFSIDFLGAFIVTVGGIWKRLSEYKFLCILL